MPQGFSFTVLAQSAGGRAGRLVTPHGEAATPVFMPVGTAASVKGLTPEEVSGSGASLILANTYHLMLRPGTEVIRRAGGVGRFMSWDGPVLTDSGGYQVLSLARRRTIDDQGVRFCSHVDGEWVTLTPENAMEIQGALRSDIAMALDECPPAEASAEDHEKAMKRTTAWARRCVAARRLDTQALFGILQGGVDPSLRKRHLEELSGLDLDGFALGGLGIGETPEATAEVIRAVAPILPGDKPRYLMGLGTPRDIIRAVMSGVDMFDCVLPTRNGRNGQAFVLEGRINIRNARHAEDPEPLDPACRCPVCRRFDRRYLHHLFVCREMLGPRLLSLHNLHHYGDLMRTLRRAILDGTLEEAAKELLSRPDKEEAES